MTTPRVGRVLLFLVPLLLVASVIGCGSDEATTEPSGPEDDSTVSPTATEPSATAVPSETSPSMPEDWTDITLYRNPDFPIGYENPIDHLPVPRHPFLAPNGRSNMHNDAYMSDTYEVSGPLGIDPDVLFRRYADSGANLCVTITFDSQGRILTTNAQMSGFRIMLVDPGTLDVLASYELPARDPADPLFPYNDTSGAAYFALDHLDRVLLSDAQNFLHVIRYSDESGEFEVIKKYDLNDYVVPMEAPARDHVQMTLPDWNREGLLWWMTRYGIIGTVDMTTDDVRTLELEGEEMQNSFTVGEDGVYFVTDHAMYRLRADEAGTPVIDWRTKYDRGSGVKPSMINQGSGTTPQLFGDMVAIGDNADPRMNILFLRRSDGALVCSVPVFDDGISTTENALPGFVREGPNGLEYSVIVENNYGKLSERIFAPGGPCADSVGGVARIDLIPDGAGGFTCREVWTSPENSCSTVPKLSLGNGLLYLHTYHPLQDDEYAWYLTAVDFETGQTVFKVRTGTGFDYNDFGAPVTLGPEGHVAYLGCLGGLVKVEDLER